MEPGKRIAGYMAGLCASGNPCQSCSTAERTQSEASDSTSETPPVPAQDTTATQLRTISALGTKEDGFLAGAFHFDAVGLHAGIVLQGMVDDAAVERIHRLQFHNVSPATNLFGRFERFLDKRIASLRAIA